MTERKTKLTAPRFSYAQLIVMLSSYLHLDDHITELLLS